MSWEDEDDWLEGEMYSSNIFDLQKVFLPYPANGDLYFLQQAFENCVKYSNAEQLKDLLQQFCPRSRQVFQLRG